MSKAVSNISNWKTAPEHKSGLFCVECKYALNEIEAYEIHRTLHTCPQCENVFAADTMGVRLRADNVQYFTDDIVKQTSWLHASTRKNWMQNLLDHPNQPLLHMGSLQSALSRARDKRDSTAEGQSGDWVVYELQLIGDVEVEKNLVYDLEEYAPSTVKQLKQQGYKANTILRYVNFYEHPGSISLIANPNKVRVVRSYPLTPQELDVKLLDLIK
jgi:hypothetical protein